MKLAKIGNYLGDKEVGWDSDYSGNKEIGWGSDYLGGKELGWYSDYLGDDIERETINILKNKGINK